MEGGYERTGARSPMQWDASLNAGFSAADPAKLYIRQDSAADRPTVAAQINDETSLYSEVKRLIAFRQAHEALRNDGEIEFIETENYPLVFVRKTANEKLLVVINPSDRKQPLGGGVTPARRSTRSGIRLKARRAVLRRRPARRESIPAGNDLTAWQIVTNATERFGAGRCDETNIYGNIKSGIGLYRDGG